MARIKNIIGNKYNRLTVIKDTNKRHPKQGVIWLCECDCGNFREVPSTRLVHGNITSCGCQRKELNKRKRNTKPRISFDEFKKRFEKEDCILKCDEWKGVVKSNIKIFCKIHGESSRTSGNLNQSRNDNPCAKCNNDLGMYNFSTFNNNKELKKKIGYVYYLKIGEFYKIGITLNLDNRLSALKFKSKSEVKLIQSYKTTLYEAYIIEQHLLKHFKKNRIKTKWSTELFDTDVLKGTNLKNIINTIRMEN